MAYEEILRQITYLEEKAEAFEERIEELKAMEQMYKEEYKYAPAKEKTKIISYLRRIWGAIGANMRWAREYREKAEKLRKLIPPIKYVEISMTFSIETEKGHQPIYCEVTCRTVVPYGLEKGEEREIWRRVVNAVLKMFYLHFDVYKDAPKKSDLGRWATHIMRKTIITENELDRLIRAIMRIGGLKRPREEYLTYQSIIKIGVERLYAIEAEPEYPEIKVIIEKGPKKDATEPIIEKTLIASDSTLVDLAEHFGILGKWERKV